MLISIFCKVIDNFGDIGVCYRLAKNLISKNIQVNLYVNDLNSFAQIANINSNLNYQILDKIKVYNWIQDINYDKADKVINAFACTLPLSYQQQMPIDIIWIQLDYLVTSTWAIEYHGLYAYIGKHKRYFFTPSFYTNTAGLLLNDFTINSQSQQELRKTYNIQPTNLNIFIFAYINKSLEQSLKILQNIQDIKIFMPISVYDKLKPDLKKNIISIPFYNQNDFDNILAIFDIIWVRGEDSFIRANLTNKPILWQAYIQEEDNEHFNKVQSFLELYLIHFATQQTSIITNLWYAINGLKQPKIEYFLQYINIIKSKEFYQGLKSWNNYLIHLPKLEDEILKL